MSELGEALGFEDVRARLTNAIDQGYVAVTIIVDHEHPDDEDHRCPVDIIDSGADVLDWDFPGEEPVRIHPTDMGWQWIRTAIDERLVSR